MQQVESRLVRLGMDTKTRQLQTQLHLKLPSFQLLFNRVYDKTSEVLAKIRVGQGFVISTVQWLLKTTISDFGSIH